MRKKKYEIRYLPLFFEELDHDITYISFELKNKTAANRLLDEVEASILRRLDDGPESFETVYSRRDRKNPYYRIYVRKYVIYYVVLEERGKHIMEIRRFMHAREDRDYVVGIEKE